MSSAVKLALQSEGQIMNRIDEGRYSTLGQRNVNSTGQRPCVVWIGGVLCIGLALGTLSVFTMLQFWDLRSGFVNLKAEIETLKIDIGTAKKENEVLKSENHDLEKRIEALETMEALSQRNGAVGRLHSDHNDVPEIGKSASKAQGLPARLKADMGTLLTAVQSEPDVDGDGATYGRIRRNADEGTDESESTSENNRRHCRTRCKGAKGDKGDRGEAGSMSRPLYHLVADEMAEEFSQSELERLRNAEEVDYRGGKFRAGAGYLVPEDGRLNIWHENVTNSETFELISRTEVEVKEAGYYHIYSQVLYVMYDNPAARNSHVIKFRNPGESETRFVTCMSLAPDGTGSTSRSSSRYVSCYTAGVTYLQQHARVWVETMYGRRRIRLLPNLSFFGMYQVSS